MTGMPVMVRCLTMALKKEKTNPAITRQRMPNSGRSPAICRSRAESVEMGLRSAAFGSANVQALPQVQALPHVQTFLGDLFDARLEAGILVEKQVKIPRLQ